eukprot:CAMPEP_0183702930 /NCGR_PEP_ID=MMETSP0737-20130205/869_1 /TAXON_ID=385413 /ORGANISM="Thalassiosira miniscula, Strain CCMP1093" /LENGTH=182 /DNA_ID=CAMNT_0025929617 /DNA_START=47 /DNA_END=595 /DNA_ORIENTATION=+
MGTTAATNKTSSGSPSQAVELGSINYVNLTPDGKHGDYGAAVRASLETGNPSSPTSWSGADDPGARTRDPSSPTRPSNGPPRSSSCPAPSTLGTETNPRETWPWNNGVLALRGADGDTSGVVTVDSGGDEQGGQQRDQMEEVRSVVVAKTKQITGRHQKDEVKRVMIQALKKLGRDVPSYLM